MRSLLRFTGVVVVLAVSSCGTDLTAPEPGPPPDVAGEWTFAELLTNARGQIQCNDYGTLTISRSDANLSGTVDQHGGCDVPRARRHVARDTLRHLVREFPGSLADRCRYYYHPAG